MPSVKLTRRDFLKLSAASAALASAGCSPPAERIVPYARQPENELPGVPRFYASAASFVGAAEGVLIESNTGRPTKVEGNPAHPGSTGSTSIHGQASVLQLWDPDRSKAPRKRGQPATRAQFDRELNDVLTRIESRRGEGLRVLIGACDSPTLAAQLTALIHRLPEARVHRWDPLHRDRSHEGARLAFGEVLEPIARIEEAGAILSLDSRFLDDHPFRLNYARQFAAARTPRSACAAFTPSRARLRSPARWPTTDTACAWPTSKPGCSTRTKRSGATCSSIGASSSAASRSRRRRMPSSIA